MALLTNFGREKKSTSKIRTAPNTIPAIILRTVVKPKAPSTPDPTSVKALMPHDIPSDIKPVRKEESTANRNAVLFFL